MNVAADVKVLSVGLVSHEAGVFKGAEVSTLGRPTFTESVVQDVGEIPDGTRTDFGLDGSQALVDDLFAKVAKSPVLEHRIIIGGSMTESPYADVKVGHSALTVTTPGTGGGGWGDGFDGGFGGGSNTYRLTFPTGKPPAGIADALAALGKLTDAAHANGPLAEGGAA
jgi:hypothetical protein